MKNLVLFSALVISLISISAHADTYVQGYYKANGSYVQGYYRKSSNTQSTNDYISELEKQAEQDLDDAMEKADSILKYGY